VQSANRDSKNARYQEDHSGSSNSAKDSEVQPDGMV
jgi:hypothetical protein